jgi:hypothetical protein
VTVPLPVQEAPARRPSRFRRAASTVCVAVGVLAVVAMLGTALAPSHPLALAEWLAVVLIGAAALGSVLNPRKVRS